MAEFFLESRPTKKSGFTVGFLDENLENEHNCQMMPGIVEAARKYQVNIIRFSYYAYHTAYNAINQIQMVYNLINQFRLDGLLFLGWAKAGPLMSSTQFNQQFGGMPVLSIGTAFKGIPSVLFEGSKYIQEILVHLLEIHQRKRIAFIAPTIPDSRIDTYVQTMKKYRLYDPELYISEKEVGYKGAARAKTAVNILLHERKVKFDAIVSLYSEEAVAVVEELQINGLAVPQDVSVTGYEDRDMAKFASPELTTVYFPWSELGYYGCEKMVELLTRGCIPLTTQVPGRVIYRNSCGCMMSAVGAAGVYDIRSANKTLDNLNWQEKQRILTAIQKASPGCFIDFHALLEAFLADYAGKTDTFFLNTLVHQLNRHRAGFGYSHCEDTITVLRRVLLPYLADLPQALLWAGDLFQQAQVLMWEKIINTYGSEKINAKIYDQNMQDVSQIIITNYSITSLMDALTLNLPKLHIPGCYIFILNSALTADNNIGNLFDTCELAFAYTDNKRIDTVTGNAQSIKQIISESLLQENKTNSYFAHLLHVTDAFMGFVIFEPGPLDDRIYQTLAAYISTGLWAAVLLEKLEASYRKLARQAHREGMADISTEVLHNIGNILNSVNTSADLMKDVIDSSAIPLDNLSKANQLLLKNFDNLRDFICKDVKGKKLMQFYIKLGDNFADFNNQLDYHINRLANKVNSINNIITAQQSYAGVNEIAEELDLVSILEDAIKLLWESLDSYKINVIKDYRATPKAMVQGVKLFSILVNLINNGKEAMQDLPANERKLIFTVSEDVQSKYIRIADSGCGIAKNLQERIFEYGYTTKKAGHGVGLYICAKYMAEMDARVWVESEGPGNGSTFVLQFK